LKQRMTRSKKNKARKLLQTAEEQLLEQDNMDHIEHDLKVEEKQQSQSPTQIGKRKTRMTLSSASKRPCDVGKELSEEALDELLGDYLYNRNGVNMKEFISKIRKYKIEGSRAKKFVLKFIQKAIDGSKGERFSDIIPKLLSEYILLSSELDEGFVLFFKGYTFEDNPLISKATAELLAPLLVDNELNFNDVLQWILLDTLQNQPKDDMLKFYEGDGVRNYIRKSQTITKALELLAFLFKELKEACFDDSDYVKKLIVGYNFKIDDYMNQKDINKKDEIQTEWIQKYGLQFAF